MLKIPLEIVNDIYSIANKFESTDALRMESTFIFATNFTFARKKILHTTSKFLPTGGVVNSIAN